MFLQTKTYLNLMLISGLNYSIFAVVKEETNYTSLFPDIFGSVHIL